ncbi:hypothetical protein M378DRAFT_78159, partial [Amanita muscaria Koide BX008]
NRWLLVEFLPISASADSALGKPAASLDAKKVYSALKHSVLHNFGDSGWGEVALSLTVKYFSPMTNICIIRVGRDQHKVAWGAVTLLTTIEGQGVVPNVVHISGTIRHAQLAAIRHNREVVGRYRAIAQTPAGYQDVYDSYLEKSATEINSLQD